MSHPEHLSLALNLIRSVNSANDPTKPLEINGNSLSIAALIKTTHLSASHSDKVWVRLTDDQETLDGLDSSLQFMLARETSKTAQGFLQVSKSTYGVTTGFGAAATTRTSQVEALQVSIIEHLLAGVTGFDADQLQHRQPDLKNIKISQPIGPQVMSESLVRGAILIRLNSLSRGHSAVRIKLLEGLINLLNHSITPVVPLRGSISASGDLSPLAYVAGALCAHPDVLVVDRSLNPPQLIKCEESLKSHGIMPLTLGPKEGLAIANGTAFSAAAAAIAVYETHVLTLLSQVVTAMMVEAVMGQIGAFHPFIHETARPHPGQIQVAKTVQNLLKNSKLINPSEHLVAKDLEEERMKQILKQDRYPLRTAPQWLGPQLEDLLSIHQTVTRELNSTTDNPLSDVKNEILHHGGNFQATSVAVSMEKLRLSIAMIGKLVFSQMTELNNSWMNKGLQSCLNGGEPSTNYHTKGLDTSSAAYCAELQYLAHPVTTHVQSAEGHNQSVNSLALISARKTLEAIEILKLLLASHIYCLCQALDLRVIENKFQQELRSLISTNLQSEFKCHLQQNPSINLHDLTESILEKFWSKREYNSSLDSKDRIRDGLEASIAPIVQVFTHSCQALPVSLIQNFLDRTLESGHDAWKYLMTGSEPLSDDTIAQLGSSRELYRFVRVELGIHFRKGDVIEGKIGKTIGSSVNQIVQSMDIGRGIEKTLIKILSDLD